MPKSRISSEKAKIKKISTFYSRNKGKTTSHFCWICGKMFASKFSMLRHFETTYHKEKVKEYTIDDTSTTKSTEITQKVTQTENFLWNILNEDERFTAFIDHIEDTTEGPLYNPSFNTLIDTSTEHPPIKIPTEPSQESQPTDPRTTGIYNVSYKEAEELVQTLEHLLKNEENTSNNNADSPENPDIVDLTTNDWLIIDEVGTTPQPEDILPPEEFDFFNLLDF